MHTRILTACRAHRALWRRPLLCLALCCLPTALPASGAPGHPTPGVQYWGMPAWPGLVDVDADAEPREAGSLPNIDVDAALPGMPPRQPGGQRYLASSGLMVRLLAEITRRLPGYTHRYLLMNQSRAFADLQRRDDLCLVGGLSNRERSQSTYFVGLFIITPPQLVIRADERQRIAGERSELALQDLLQRKDLHGAIQKGRLYGEQLDPLLASARASARLELVQSSGMGENLLNMLQARRIDYTIEYAEKVQSRAAARDPLEPPLIHLPLSEANQPGIAGIHCPRTPHGRELVRQIDAIARQPEVLAVFRDGISGYIPPTERQRYDAWITRFFQQRGQQALTNLDD